jgi:hypothetical protein
MSWLYAPYDGGAGGVLIVGGGQAAVHLAGRAHEDWLSAHRSGL